MMIVMMIFAALANGVLVMVSRMLNARLGREIGSAGASVWNHLTGTIVMLAVFIFMGGSDLNLREVPFYAFTGGIIGAVYVTFSNFLIPKIGASKATVLMLAGQICIATLIDFLRHIFKNPVTAVAGIVLIITGVYLGEKNKTKTD